MGSSGKILLAYEEILLLDRYIPGYIRTYILVAHMNRYVKHVPCIFSVLWWALVRLVPVLRMFRGGFVREWSAAAKPCSDSLLLPN